MPRISLVLEFTPNDELPSFSANTRVLGGRVVAFAAGDKLVDPVMTKDEHTKAIEGLSSRERQVLMLLAEGLNTDRMAAIVGINRKTINSYRYRIHEQLGVENDIQAVLMFINSKSKEIEQC